MTTSRGGRSSTLLPGGGADLGDHPEEAAPAAPAADGGSKSVTGPAGPPAFLAASTAATLADSAISAAFLACRAAFKAISPTSRTPSSEARAITTASSIRALSSATVGTTPRGTTQSCVLSRCEPSITAQFRRAGGGKFARRLNLQPP